MVATLDGYLSPSKAAQQIGVAPITLKLWAKQGRVPALRTPIGLVFRTEDVEQLARQRAERMAPA